MHIRLFISLACLCTLLICVCISNRKVHWYELILYYVVWVCMCVLYVLCSLGQLIDNIDWSGNTIDKQHKIINDDGNGNNITFGMPYALEWTPINFMRDFDVFRLTNYIQLSYSGSLFFVTQISHKLLAQSFWNVWFKDHSNGTHVGQKVGISIKILSQTPKACPEIDDKRR